MTIKRIAGPVGRLHVDDGGAGGLPVVFVHSFAGSAAHWSAQLAHLWVRRRALAIDLRGHGRSEATARDDFNEGYWNQLLAGAQPQTLAQITR